MKNNKHSLFYNCRNLAWLLQYSVVNSMAGGIYDYLDESTRFCRDYCKIKVITLSGRYTI